MPLFLNVVAIIFISYSKAEAADCLLPNSHEILHQLEQIIDDNDTVSVDSGDLHYTCLSQGEIAGTYRFISVILNYTTLGDNSTVTRQFELHCVQSKNLASHWEAVSVSGDLTMSPSANYDAIELRTDCSSCSHLATNDHHCVACDSKCGIGLMRCAGSSSNDCCVAFEDDGVCKADFNCNKKNYIANEITNFTCACILASCEIGYTFNSLKCTCDLTDICAAINPCIYGECILGSSPDQYTCNCTGTNYTGTNCSVAKDSAVPAVNSASDTVHIGILFGVLSTVILLATTGTVLIWVLVCWMWFNNRKLLKYKLKFKIESESSNANEAKHSDCTGRIGMTHIYDDPYDIPAETANNEGQSTVDDARHVYDCPPSEIERHLDISKNVNSKQHHTVAQVHIYDCPPNDTDSISQSYDARQVKSTEV